jgi:3',5'-cyclic AMP phosphodiesterase CpdA
MARRAGGGYRPVAVLRHAEYPRPDHVLLHLSDTHLIAGEERLYGTVDADARLRELLERIESARIVPSALVVTGDLVDAGEPAAYRKLRTLFGSFAARLGCEVVWVMGNHDDRAAMRQHLLAETASGEPLDRVYLVDGLRIVALDTTVPGHHYGQVTEAQLEWLAGVLGEPAPFGTVLAIHHPPLPTVADLAVTVELREQHRLARVLAGTDVRAILAGHLHYSTFGTFAGIPVSVASSTCYTQDLAFEQSGTRGHDAAQAFSLVHVYPDTVVHSVVPLASGPAVGEVVTAGQARSRLEQAGIVIGEAPRIPRHLGSVVSGSRA